MSDNCITQIRRNARPGLPDDQSEPGVYVARWTDEDTGPHVVRIQAGSARAARASLEPYITSNDLVVHGPMRRAQV